MNWVKLIKFISLAVLALNLTGERIFLAGQKFEALAVLFDRALFLKIDYYQAWIERGNVATRSTRAESLFASFSPLVIQNQALNLRGYEGALTSYQEGLKYIHKDTHPEGWGQLHQAIGKAHYQQGRGNIKSHFYWYQAVSEYQNALQALTETTFPELHLEVLQDLIRALLGLGQVVEAEELIRRGSDLLRRLLVDNHSDLHKKQLALKFNTFNKL